MYYLRLAYFIFFEYFKGKALSIYSEITKSEIDWIRVEKEIKELGEHINDFNEDNCILSDLYYGFEGDGSILTKVTELFIKHGFDVNANDGYNGSSCLHELCWSSDDCHIIETAELLLNAGANSKLPDVGDESSQSVTDTMDWRLDDWLEDDYYTANLFRVYYEMIYAYENEKPYSGIRAFEECIGLKVDKVEKATYDKKFITADVDKKGIFSGDIIIWAEGISVNVSSFPAAMIHPYRVESAVNKMDISDEFAGIIGARVEGIDYISVQSIEISFDNGYRLNVSRNIFENNKSEYAKYVLDIP